MPPEEAVPAGESSVAGAIRSATRAHAAFDLKGVTVPVTVLRLRSRDLNLFERQLRAKVAQMPAFFAGAPVVLDMGGLGGGADLSLASLVHALRANRLVPVGVANIGDDQRESARSAGLGVIDLQAATGKADKAQGAAEMDVPGPATDVSEPAPPAATSAAPRAVPTAAPQSAPPAGGAPAASPTAPSAAGAQQARPPVVVRQPVRSGQVIYAEGTDLILLAPANPGAQLVADGHVHAYGSLRGRAVAGAQGRVDARIFVQKLEAELLAVAGTYIMSDDFPKEHRGRPAQVYLDAGRIRVAAL